MDTEGTTRTAAAQEPSPAAPAGPTPVAARLRGPDIARGGMLLLIALANVHVWAFGFTPGYRGYPADQGPLERVFTVAQMLLVDGRAFPLFAVLFGYGLVQLVQGKAAALPAERLVRLVRRRGLCLTAIGLAHAALLFTADIVALYGLLAVLLAGVVVTGRDRRLLQIAGRLAVPALALGALRLLPPELLGITGVVEATPSPFAGDVLGTLASRAAEWLSNGLRVLALAPAVLLGAWAARRRLLTTPAARPLLTRTLLIGGPVGIAAGVPAALLAASGDTSVAPPAAILGAGALHAAGGYAVAAAYLAAFGLAATSRAARGRWAGDVLAAAGRWSLTLYLAQSVVFLAVLDPLLGGLGDTFTLPLMAALAAGTWLATTAVAALLQRAGLRGPAETLLRRLTYGRRSSGPVSP